jgi:hypothetical protein
MSVFDLRRQVMSISKHEEAFLNLPVYIIPLAIYISKTLTCSCPAVNMRLL